MASRDLPLSHHVTDKCEISIMIIPFCLFAIQVVRGPRIIQAHRTLGNIHKLIGIEFSAIPLCDVRNETYSKLFLHDLRPMRTFDDNFQYLPNYRIHCLTGQTKMPTSLSLSNFEWIAVILYHLFL